MDKINIYINSKNRKENENANKFTVKIPNNLQFERTFQLVDGKIEGYGTYACKEISLY